MPLTNIVVSDDTKPVLVFEGWKAVPRSYRTQAGWTLDFRTVKQEERSTASVVIKWTRKMETIDVEHEIERPFKLYHVSQTRPIRKTPLNLARREFFRYFGECSERSRLIRWTKGEYRIDEDGEKWWDSNADVWGWRTFKEWLGLQKVIDHTTGKELYGVFGSESSYYLLIDLDLHNQPLELFLKRLKVFLDRFHGDCRCHFQISDRNAGGIHLILFFGTKSSLKSRKKWITGILHDLDRKHPECEFFKKGRRKDKLNIEVYPGNNPHRLPLARGRTMLLDKPLQILERRGKAVQDVVGYIKWLENPNRSYMSKNEVLWFILDRLDLSAAKWSQARGKKQKNEQQQDTAAEIQKPAEKSRSLKYRTRSALVGFWDKGEEGHFPHLNAAVFTTLQALHAEGLAEDDAVDVVMKYVDELPNAEISSRLGSGRSLIERDTVRDAAKIWGKSVNQKWQAVVEHWGRLGFRVSDKTTWDVRSGKLDVVVDCEDIQITTEERQLLIEQVAPLLVGKKQAMKPEKQDEVCKAVAYFLRYVRCCDREIPYTALPAILSGFDLKIKNHDKQRRFFRLLIKMDWLYVRAAYYHPAKHGGNGKTGRATAYGIGRAMTGKFSSSLNTKENRSYILSPTFYQATAFDVVLPSFDEQAGTILAETGTHRRQPPRRAHQRQ